MPKKEKEKRIYVRIEYPENLVTEPVLYQMGRTTGVVYSISRAYVDVKEKKRNFIEAELSGEKSDLEEALKFLISKRVGLIIFGPSPFGFLRIPAGGFQKMEEKNENDK